ncbi:serum paraoxonase/arylesterase 1-like [Pecten maximus]|uniref:serum paraoxonase/arylesterase 1-like n=1 Tax=Pecten maximus TaxID=6579 RepID=UPI0014590D8A|nr:serum paraoxonase/arylesterase 1-like [Pecten maximus]
MSTLRSVLIAGLLAVTVQYVIRHYFYMQYDKYDVMYRHAPGPCVSLEGADGGSEDLTILPSGLALISSGIYPNKQGRILLLDMNESSPTVTEAQIRGTGLDMATFNPHGLSTWINPNTGEITLMVINHVPGEERVEVFRYQCDSKSLVHLKSITSSLWGKYFTFRKPLLRKIEHDLMLPLGEVMFYDGVSARSVAKGLLIPNGINKSPDGRFLYVANSGTSQVKSYEILDNNDIKFMENIFLDTTLDNIEVDRQSGDLWIGCHPRYHQIIKHDAQYGGTITPSQKTEAITLPAKEQQSLPSLAEKSQILKLATSGGRFTDVVEVYLDPGTKMTGSTAASIYKGRMLGGTLATQLMLCDVIYTD